MKNHITKGGRKLRLAYSVQWWDSLGKWIVGCGSFWTGRKTTLFQARREAAQRNRIKDGLS